MMNATKSPPLPAEPDFSARDVGLFTRGRVTSGLLRMWVSSGYLKFPLPSQQGKERRFNFAGVMEIVLVNEISLQGVKTETAAKWAHSIWKEFSVSAKGDGLFGVYAWSPTSNGVRGFAQDVTIRKLTKELGPGVALVNVVELLARARRDAQSIIQSRPMIDEMQAAQDELEALLQRRGEPTKSIGRSKA